MLSILDPMSKSIQRVTVYCASSSNIAEKYFNQAEALALIFVKEDVEVVYGGGSVGIMGKIADTIIKHKGRIKGIIPNFMRELEWQHPEVEDMHVVKDMHERKQMFFENIDAVVALPGGCGTFEELLEAITWKQLNIFHKPIIILNTDGYYDPLKMMLDRAIEEGFIRSEHARIWKFVHRAEDVIPAILDMGDDRIPQTKGAKIKD